MMTHERLKNLSPAIMRHGEAIARLLAQLAEEDRPYDPLLYRQTDTGILEMEMLLTLVKKELAWQEEDMQQRQGKWLQ